MLPRAARSALLGYLLRGGLLRLGLREGLLDRRAVRLVQELLGLGGCEVALAGVPGGVRVDRKALKCARLVGVARRDGLPGAGGVGVLVELGVRAGGEDRGVGLGRLGQRLIAIPSRDQRGELLLARSGELAGSAVVVGVVARGRGPARRHELRPRVGVVGIRLGGLQCGLLLGADGLALGAPGAVARERVQDPSGAVTGTDAEQNEAATQDDGETKINGLNCAPAAASAKLEKNVYVGSRPSDSDEDDSAAARAAARRSAILSITILARYKTTSGSISNAVVTGSAPGMAAAMTAMITVA